MFLLTFGEKKIHDTIMVIIKKNINMDRKIGTNIFQYAPLVTKIPHTIN